uniref:IMS import disulfide relay-system CHCH-CHCH-like Cx9C domain-containing protein n=1 Tax=Aegilops tauschii subsp. strangulata TaxID=200361 RepID=A0A453LLM7_AEGTS
IAPWALPLFPRLVHLFLQVKSGGGPCGAGERHGGGETSATRRRRRLAPVRRGESAAAVRSRMGRKAGLYINPKKFGGVVKPCMLEMTAFLNCLALNKQIDEKCTRQKELLITCTQAQKGRPKNAAKTINYHLQRLGRDKFH